MLGLPIMAIGSIGSGLPDRAAQSAPPINDAPSQAQPARMPPVMIELPERPAASADPSTPVTQSAAPSPRRSARVLLVEDHLDTLRTLKRLLVSLGHEVTAVDGMARALAEADAADERFRTLAGTASITAAGNTAAGVTSVEPFDILVSDIGLHDGSGWDLMRKLRERYPKLRGIAFSGYGMENDLRNSQDAGFEVHLTKPTGVQQIDEAIRGMLGK